MLDCRQVQSKIADYSVGLLRTRETAELESHLAACAVCAREWRELQAVLGLVERYGSREAPSHLWNGVCNRITGNATHDTSGFWERLFGGPRRLIASTAAGLATAALVAAVSLPRLFAPSPPLPVPAPSIAVKTAVAAQQHAMLASTVPFADEVGLEAYAQLVNNPDVHPDVVQ